MQFYEEDAPAANHQSTKIKTVPFPFLLLEATQSCHTHTHSNLFYLSLMWLGMSEFIKSLLTGSTETHVRIFSVLSAKHVSLLTCICNTKRSIPAHYFIIVCFIA